MRGFVEKREPEVVITQMTKAEQQESLALREELRSTTCPAAARQPGDYKRNSCLRARSTKCGKKFLRVPYKRQLPNGRQNRLKAVPVPRRTINLRRLDFAMPKPS